MCEDCVYIVLVEYAMGGVYTLYARRKDNDKYVEVRRFPRRQVDMWKHHVVCYAMDKKHMDLKSLYLYDGYFRVCKALIRGGYLELTFNSSETAEEWDSCEERVCDVPWLFRDFGKRWKPVHVEYSYMRVYQKH